MSVDELDGGLLTYSPPAGASGDGFTTFEFKVNDGTDDSASAYTMTIDVTSSDTAAPGVTSIERGNPALSPTNEDELTWRVAFSENVQNVDAADFAVSGTTAMLAAAAVPGSSSRYDVTASGGDLAGLNATVTLSFAGGQDIADTAGNVLSDTAPTDTNENTYDVDNTAPTVEITDVPTTSSAPFTATFTFSEAVTGFALGDIEVGNGTASEFMGTDGELSHTALITPAADGLVTVDVAKDVATDQAGNDNTAATQATSTYTAPVTNSPPTVANEILDQAATAGTAFSYQFPANTFADADDDPLTYEATQSDDTALPAWLTFADETRTFSGTPQAGDVGTVTVKVTASDEESATVSDEFAIVVQAQTGGGICDRTQEVQDELVNRISAVTDCAEVTDEHLAGITGSLSLLGKRISTLAAGDFAGLEAVTELDLRFNALTTLPEGVFDGLDELTVLNLSNNALTTLPEGVFDELDELTVLNLSNNALTTLPEGVFEGLDALTELNLNDNALTTLPEGVFDGLDELTELNLSSNDLTTLPADVFDGLGKLTELYLSRNALTTLPANVFDGLDALEFLGLSNNALATLPAGVFEPLSALTTLTLQYNLGAPFSPGAEARPDDGEVSPAGGDVTLDGSRSDGGPWGTNLTYKWVLTDPASGVDVTFDDDTSVMPKATVGALAVDDVLTFTLTVSGRGDALVQGDGVVSGDGIWTSSNTATVTARNTTTTAPPPKGSLLIGTDAGSADHENITSTRIFAQEFSTGSNENGYTLTRMWVSVGRDTGSLRPNAYDISIWSADGSGNPDQQVFAWDVDSAFYGGGLKPYIFLTAPDDPATALYPNTTYFIVAKTTGLNINLNFSHPRQRLQERGWNIATRHLESSNSGSTWSSASYLIAFKIFGIAISSPVRLGALTVTATQIDPTLKGYTYEGEIPFGTRHGHHRRAARRHHLDA